MRRKMAGRLGRRLSALDPLASICCGPPRRRAVTRPMRCARSLVLSLAMLAASCRQALVSVVLLEVVLDGSRVFVFNRRTERLDHFGHFGIPKGRAWKRRVHLDVVETMASGAICLHLVQPGRLLQLDWPFIG